MDAIVLIGRIVFSLIFFGSGVGHLMQTSATAEVAVGRGLPAARLLVQISGIAMLLGGIGVAFGIWTDLALLGIGLLVLIMGVAIHQFWSDEGERQQVEMAHFMKNLTIAGASLALFGFFAYGYDALQVVGPALSLE
jgi:uncharacterized membrane protein YphA (DoxX/SURF4 family)